MVLAHRKILPVRISTFSATGSEPLSNSGNKKMIVKEHVISQWETCFIELQKILERQAIKFLEMGSKLLNFDLSIF